MNNVTMPSGATVINLLSTRAPKDATASTADSAMESTSGAMVLDVPGKCPKCIQQMGIAHAQGEQVFYCVPCRVSLPLPIIE